MHFELIHTGHVIGSLLLVRQVKASFVVKGDRAGGIQDCIPFTFYECNTGRGAHPTTFMARERAQGRRGVWV